MFREIEFSNGNGFAIFQLCEIGCCLSRGGRESGGYEPPITTQIKKAFGAINQGQENSWVVQVSMCGEITRLPRVAERVHHLCIFRFDSGLE
jgi:hypothetical protein